MNTKHQVVDANQKAAVRNAAIVAKLAVTGKHGDNQPQGSNKKNKKPKPKMRHATMTFEGDSAIDRDQLVSLMHPDLANYLRTLSDPWRDMRVFCPVNYNPVPSFVTQYARTTFQLISKTINGGTATNLVLYPGHAGLANQQVSNVAGAQSMNVSDFDEVAYHAYLSNFLGANRVVGPATTITIAGNTMVPTIGGWIDGLPAAGVTNASSGMQPLTYDQTLPYTLSTGIPGHGRWKLTSMGVRIINTTPVQFRGGSIISYQPINNVPQAAGTITQYARLPTYKDWGPDKAEITWIPRMRDCAFWHLSSQQLVATGNDIANAELIPGISVSITAPNGANQTYDVVGVCNWELAGDLFASVGSKGTHRPELKSVVERVHAELVNTRATAREALTVGAQAFHAVRQGLGVVARVGRAVSTGAAMLG